MKTLIKKILGYKGIYWILKVKHILISSTIDKGQHCYIDKTVQFIGKTCIQLGDNVCIGMNVNININGSRNDEVKRLFIASNSYIGRDTFICTGKIVKIGEFFLGWPHCSIIGANHSFTNPITSYLLSDISLDKEIEIEENVWLGDHVTILGSVTIGRGSIIGACSVVTKDIPPFSIAVGNPCKVIKRFDFKKEQWIKVDDFNAETAIPSREEYLNLLHKNNESPEMPIVALTNRFGSI